APATAGAAAAPGASLGSVTSTSAAIAGNAPALGVQLGITTRHEGTPRTEDLQPRATIARFGLWCLIAARLCTLQHLDATSRADGVRVGESAASGVRTWRAHAIFGVHQLSRHNAKKVRSRPTSHPAHENLTGTMLAANGPLVTAQYASLWSPSNVCHRSAR